MSFLTFIAKLAIIAILSTLTSQSVHAAHGYAIWDNLKYPENFKHFDYVNPNAPKGGEIRMVSNLRVSTFDKYNPFTMRGNAPAYLSTLMFDTLLTTPLDEDGAAYGLLAKEVKVSNDRLSVEFTLNENAKFHDESPVLSKDVKYTFDVLMGDFVSPAYKTVLEDIDKIEIINERKFKFYFKKVNRQLPIIVASIPIFSHKWGQGKDFDKVIMDIPIGSGAYKIGDVKFGKDITYVRNPNYWARDLNVKRGTGNFDKITIKIYKDSTASLEAFKAGEFDLMTFYSASDWVKRVNGKKFTTGELVKQEFTHNLPTGFQSYVLNTRKEFLKDIRVREALGLAIDYEWLNRQIFYGSYKRVKGLFGNTSCEAKGMPSDDELALMNPLKKQFPNEIPNAAFENAYTPPRTDLSENGLRENLLKAKELLKQAGWTISNGRLVNEKGEPMVLEYLDSNESGIRVVFTWIRNLEKLGIKLIFKPVDFAIYQQKLQKFDFDITSIAYQGSSLPGVEYFDLFGQKAANTPDSGNFAGVKSAAIDDLILKMTKAENEKSFIAACKSLERVVTNSHYLLAQWYSSTHRMAYNAWRLEKPSAIPPYFAAATWAMDLWWAK